MEALFSGIRVINLSQSLKLYFSAASNKLSDIECLSDLDRNEFFNKIVFLHWENNELEKALKIKKYL